MSSSILYGIIVIDANTWIAQRTSTHTWVSIALVVASILSYYLFFWAENFFTFSGPNYEAFNETMADLRGFLVVVLCAW